MSFWNFDLFLQEPHSFLEQGKEKREALFTHIPTLLKHISPEKETSQFPKSQFVNENFIIAT